MSSPTWFFVARTSPIETLEYTSVLIPPVEWRKMDLENPKQSALFRETYTRFFESLEAFDPPWCFPNNAGISEEASPNTLSQFPFIRKAISLVNASVAATHLEVDAVPTHTGIIETSTLTCLLYIIVTLQQFSSSMEICQVVEDDLSSTTETWSNSVENLRWILLLGTGKSLRNLKTVQYVEKLTEVSTWLDWVSWQKMREHLLGVLCCQAKRRCLEYINPDALLAKSPEKFIVQGGWVRGNSF
jgi:hypothetical protein